MTNQERDKVLEKIRQLLAVAESTKFPEEAEAFFAKAAELMTKYTIEEAELRVKGQSKASEVISRQVHTPGRQVLAKARRELLHIVARANRCRPFTTGANGRGPTVIVGHESDVRFVEMLYTSLLAHMLSSMEQALRERVDTSTHASVFRNNFAHAYAQRIGIRLYEANQAASAATTALVPWIGEVDEWVKAVFGDSIKTQRDTGRKRRFDPSAQVAGDVAARQANISGVAGEIR